MLKKRNEMTMKERYNQKRYCYKNKESDFIKKLKEKFGEDFLYNKTSVIKNIRKAWIEDNREKYNAWHRMNRKRKKEMEKIDKKL